MADAQHPLLKRPLYVFDLPPEILSTLKLKQPSETSSERSLPDAEDTSRRGEPEEVQSPKSTACQRCNLSFATWHDQRHHFRSDLHGYNTKLSLKGLNPVTESEFDKLVGDLDESISGSESSGSDTDAEDEVKNSSKRDTSMLNSLLEKQAKIHDSSAHDLVPTNLRKRGSGKPPLVWFESTELPKNVSLGIYRAIFTDKEQVQEGNVVDVLRHKQLSPITYGSKQNPNDGGVALPTSSNGPHVFLCMIGGGHFAAMIVSLAPKIGKKHGHDERQASVIAHKTFHRYTTRRKQGGAQSANDSAKGAAHSAGSTLRRYNESALMDEIRALLGEWKTMVDSSELLFIRATGNTNRRTLFGPYEDQVLRQDDPRNRGFPFSTRRATQAELMRCFVEITRVKVSEVDEAALAVKAKAEEEARNAAAQSKLTNAAQKSNTSTTRAKDNEDEVAELHTTQIESMIKRSRAPGLISYLQTNSLTPEFRLHPHDSRAHHHSPVALHLASSSNAHAVVLALLTKGSANPNFTNADGKTAFELAGDRATRDAFRLARSELGESKWDWEAAKVPDPLTKAETERRAELEREDEEAKEEERRKADLKKLRQEDAKKQEQRQEDADQRREKAMGKGKVLQGKNKTAEERREEDARGMTPEMKNRLERERRARAAEERMRRMAGVGPGAGPG